MAYPLIVSVRESFINSWVVRSINYIVQSLLQKKDSRPTAAPGPLHRSLYSESLHPVATASSPPSFGPPLKGPLLSPPALHLPPVPSFVHHQLADSRTFLLPAALTKTEAPGGQELLSRPLSMAWHSTHRTAICLMTGPHCENQAQSHVVFSAGLGSQNRPPSWSPTPGHSLSPAGLPSTSAPEG